MTAPVGSLARPFPVPAYVVSKDFLLLLRRGEAIATDEEGCDMVTVMRRAIVELVRSTDILRASYLMWTSDNVFIRQATRFFANGVLGWLEGQCRA
jgi:hypothetical protein